MVKLVNDINLSINVALKLHVLKIGQEYVNISLISYHSDQNDSFSYTMNIALNIKRKKLRSHLV